MNRPAYSENTHPIDTRIEDIILDDGKEHTQKISVRKIYEDLEVIKKEIDKLKG